jgi:hypothetical protein
VDCYDLAGTIPSPPPYDPPHKNASRARRDYSITRIGSEHVWEEARVDGQELILDTEREDLTVDPGVQWGPLGQSHSSPLCAQIPRCVRARDCGYRPAVAWDGAGELVPAGHERPKGLGRRQPHPSPPVVEPRWDADRHGLPPHARPPPLPFTRARVRHPVGLRRQALAAQQHADALPRQSRLPLRGLPHHVHVPTAPPGLHRLGIRPLPQTMETARTRRGTAVRDSTALVVLVFGRALCPMASLADCESLAIVIRRLRLIDIS